MVVHHQSPYVPTLCLTQPFSRPTASTGIPIMLSTSTSVVRSWTRASLFRSSYSSRPLRRAFSSVTVNDIAHFSKILDSSSIISTLSPINSSAEDIHPFNNDWMKKYSGRATTVLKPRTTQQVSEILKWCNEKNIPVVPQGGNTGLVGGSIPLNDEVVISLANMSQVRSFDPISGTLFCLPLHLQTRDSICYQGYLSPMPVASCRVLRTMSRLTII